MARTSNLTHLCFRRQHISTADRHMLCCSGATPATGAGKLLHFKSSAAQFDPRTQHRLNVGSKEPEILFILCKCKNRPTTCTCRHTGKAEAYAKTIRSAALWDGWSLPRSGHFTSGNTQYPLYKKLGDPWGQSKRHGKSLPHRDSILGTSSLQTVAIMTTLAWPFGYFMYMIVKTNSIGCCRY